MPTIINPDGSGSNKVDKTGDIMSGPLTIDMPFYNSELGGSNPPPLTISQMGEIDRGVTEIHGGIIEFQGIDGSISHRFEGSDYYSKLDLSSNSVCIEAKSDTDGYWTGLFAGERHVDLGTARGENHTILMLSNEVEPDNMGNAAKLIINDDIYVLYGEHNPPPVPEIPDQLSDLADDDTHRTVTDTEKTTWNSKADHALDYTGTLPNTSWSGSSAPYTKNVTVTGIVGSGAPPIIDVVLSETWDISITEEEQWAHIKQISYSDNTLTFYADEVPSIVLNFQGVQST